MPTKSEEISFSTKHEGHIVDITQQVQKAVTKSDLNDGIACVFVSGATGAVTIGQAVSKRYDLPARAQVA